MLFLLLCLGVFLVSEELKEDLLVSESCVETRLLRR